MAKPANNRNASQGSEELMEVRTAAYVVAPLKTLSALFAKCSLRSTLAPSGYSYIIQRKPRFVVADLLQSDSSEIQRTIRAPCVAKGDVLPVQRQQQFLFVMCNAWFRHTLLVCTLRTDASGMMRFLETRQAVLKFATRRLKMSRKSFSTSVTQGHGSWGAELQRDWGCRQCFSSWDSQCTPIPRLARYLLCWRFSMKKTPC
jgi:hypothetical protein